MEVRPIRPEEKTTFDKIQTIAFMFRRDFIKEEKEGITPDSAQLLVNDGYRTGRAAFDDNGRMCSCLDLIPYEVTFDGNTVKMGGIGGVASLPEERDKKYIRHIFEYIMNEMYENGYVFSYLYPFSHIYYRKFGYELNMTAINYSIPISSFRQFGQTGRMSMVTDDAGRQIVKALYEEYINDKNLAVVRTDKLWQRRFNNDPYRDGVFLYIWYNSQNEARGYVQYHTEKTDGIKASIVIRELVWLDTEALKGIFAFMGKFGSQADKLVWKVPSFTDLVPFFDEPYDVGQEIHMCGMNRIVNVQKALGLMALPEGGGEVVIGVRDDFFPVNTGNYSISWNGQNHSVQKTDAGPDLLCDIQALTQLVTGFLTPDDLEAAGKITVNAKRDVLAKIFRPKRLFINDYF
ncbi:MAG TPA: GNAT family N-acetyltransferase [Clostridiales bacterium]|nr:GNAT family N-acetyltransferase [Clostridiales bacterium]